MAPERKCRRLIRREYANPVTTRRDLQILYMIGYITRWDMTPGAEVGLGRLG